MATGLETLTQLMGLNQAIRGQSQSSTTNKSGTSTTQGNISEEGIQRMIDQILAGPGGIKDISSRARGAGLYNSTTEQQLTNDLVARTAGELAARQAGTTTTTDETIQTDTVQPGVGLGSSLATMGALALGKPILQKALGMGTDAIGSLFGGGTSMADASINSLLGAGIANPSFIGSVGANTLGNMGGFLSGTGSDLLGNVTAGAGLAESLGTTLGGVGELAPGFALNAIPGVGSFLGGLLGGGDPSDMSGFGLGASALAGLATAGPVGLLMGPAMSVLGGGLGGVSIVCTALKDKGLLDRELYEAGRDYLAKMDAEVRMGYLQLFSGIAKKIEEGNKFWTYACLPFARGRTALLASKSKWKYLKHPVGSLTKFVGEPLCKLYYKINNPKQAYKATA